MNVEQPAELILEQKVEKLIERMAKLPRAKQEFLLGFLALLEKEKAQAKG